MARRFIPNAHHIAERPLQPFLNWEPEAEETIRRKMTSLAKHNEPGSIIFTGGGAYDHTIPSVVEPLSMQANLVTSYTQYQAELTQGYLLALIEYQTMISQLTGMEMAVGSHYDAATALSEAALMAIRIGKEKKTTVLVSGGVSPLYRETMETILVRGLGLTIQTLPLNEKGQTDLDSLPELLEGGNVACLIVQQPNYFGVLEDCDGVSDTLHAKDALLILSCYPIALGMIKTPGAYGADIATGELQSLGLPLSFGGPYAGYFCTKLKYIRETPGRIVAESIDMERSRAYTLALGPREQHIRRFKATSNICSNQAHCTLRVAITLATWGQSGITEIATQCHAKAVYLALKIKAMPHFKLVYPDADFFNEFLVEGPMPIEKYADTLEGIRILYGAPILVNNDRQFMIAVTEKHTREDLDLLALALDRVNHVFQINNRYDGDRDNG